MKALTLILGRLVRDKPWLIVIAVTLVTALAIIPLSQFEMKPDNRDLLPRGGTVDAQNRLIERLPGGTRGLAALVEGRTKNVFDRAALLDAARVSAALRSDERTAKMFPGPEYILGPHRVVELFLAEVNRAVKRARCWRDRVILAPPRPWTPGIASCTPC